VTNVVTPRAARRDVLPYLVGAATIVIALVFLVYPLASAVFGAFIKNGQASSIANLTLVNFERFFVSASYQRALWNSLFAGTVSTALATLLALPMAFAVARIEMPFRSLILGLSVIPLISPPFIGAYAWILLLGNNGLITQVLNLYLGIPLPSIYGPLGVIVALAFSYFPYVFLIVQGALVASDPYIEEAARMMGASRWHILRTITFVWVAIVLGGSIAVAEPRQPVTKTAVSVAIRPEKVKLSRRGPASDALNAHALNRLEGIVTDVSYLGGVTTYKVKLDTGAVLRSSMANTARLDIDAYHASQRVVAWFTPDDCVVLEQ